MLQRWWDEHWARQPIMLVLCGSILSMMHRETLARSSPLYGRRTSQWLITPMRFREVAVAAVDAGGRVVGAGECRWSRRPLGARAAEELARKLGRTWPGCEASMRLMLFSASGFTGAAHRWAETRGVSLIGPGEDRTRSR